MPTSLAPMLIQQFKDNNGNPLVGGQLYTYLAGTSTPTASYTDSTGTTPNANPVILNSRGEAPFWLTPGQFYKIVLQDAAGVLIWSADQVPGGALDAGFLQSGASAVGRTTLSKSRDVVSVRDFGAVGDGVTDDTSAFQAAAAAFPNSDIVIPGNSTFKLTADVTAYWVEQYGVSYTNSRAIKKRRGFYTDFAGGANITRVRDRLLVGEACLYDGSRSSGVFGWLGQLCGGIYAYLATCTNIYSTNDGVKGGIAITGAARDGGVSTAANPTAMIAVAAVAWQDTPGSTGGVWGLYSTVVKEAGTNGGTFGMEIDIANKGTTASIAPANMFPTGVNAGIWLCSGGEITGAGASAGTAKTASVALGILCNDPAGVANFDKGIVFHNKALAGTDGATGEATAIAFAKGHRLDWFNNSNVVVGSILSTGTNTALAHRLQFTDSGLTVTHQQSSALQMQVPVVANAANYLQMFPAVAGSPPIVKAAGTDANIDLLLAPTGTGRVKTTYGVGLPVNPAAFVANNWLEFKDGNGNIIYLAGRLTTW